MNEEIDQAILKILNTIAQWDIFDIKPDMISIEKTKTAKELQFLLSILKLTVGISNFEELPAFSRYLTKVTKYLDKVDRLEEQEVK